MKKSVIAILAGLVSAATFAASPDDVVLAFSTKGPDKYRDNTTVVDGEYYAVVWTSGDPADIAIDADGRATDGKSKVVLKAALAKDGKCPSVVFRLPADYVVGDVTVGSLANTGTWCVCLLDTRTFKTYTDADGVEKIQTDESGDPVNSSVGGNSVNGYNVVGNAANLGVAGADSAAVENAKASGTASSLEIKDIKIVGDNVHISVAGARPTLAYQLTSGDEPAPEGGLKQVQLQYGNTEGENGEMLIVTPKKSGAQFFQVNRK